MKKLAIIVLFCLLLSSCSISADYETPTKSDGTDEAITDATVKQNDNSSNSPNIGADGNERAFSISSYEDYLKFLSDPILPKDFGEAQLPNDFITFEALGLGGEFQSLLFPTCSFHYYIYDYVDESGFSLSISVQTSYNPTPTEKEYLMQAPQDLRMINTTENRSFLIGNTEYVYKTGKLMYIIWIRDGMKLVISGNDPYPWLNHYPTTKSTTFLSQLLNIETVEAASNRLAEAVAPALQAR